MKPLAKTLEDSIFGKLKLQDTYLFQREDSHRFSSLAPLLFGRQSYLGANRMASLRGEGAIVSTTADTMNFFKYFVEQRINGAYNQQLISEAKKLYPGVSYGQGVMVIDIPRGIASLAKLPKALGHLGATGHFMAYVPALGVFLVGTINQLAKPLLNVKFLAEMLSALTFHAKAQAKNS
jgi:D-alanyl-D-alanine carboxypeptidase